MSERDRWILHNQKVPAQNGVDILAAERLALEGDRWRRWVERQINGEERCRQMALRHMRYLATRR